MKEIKFNKKIIVPVVIAALLLLRVCANLSRQVSVSDAGGPSETLVEGEREIKALAQAYSGQIEKIEKRDEEWAFFLDDTWFYWKGGRLLPESKIEDKNNYHSYGFYDYPIDFPENLILPDKNQLERRKHVRGVPVDTTFLDTLYGGSSYGKIRENIRRINFLGFRIDAHEKIIPILEKIELEIREAELEGASIAGFLENLRTIYCFSWRDIDDSVRRSYHSYGVAVDFIPANTSGKAVYWLWTKTFNERWYSVPYNRRWMVPEKIVNIFEKYGFIWGGKWLFYDNMHFEYRPELLIMAGKDVKAP